MNDIFDALGIILIAVDDKFTLEDKVGEIQKDSVHGQFLKKYYNEESGHKNKIAEIVANRGGATEVVIEIDDKTFVLFAYSKLADLNGFVDTHKHELSFVEIIGSIEKVFNYCKSNFPNKVIHTVPIGAETQNVRCNGIRYSVKDAKNRIKNLANAMGLPIEIIMRDEI